MKRLLINLILILICFVTYFLQSNFFNWFTISGIKPNLFIIYILFIGLFGPKNYTIIYSSIIGIILDLLFKDRIGINLTGLITVGIIAMIFDKNFSKDSRITLIFMISASTIIYEIISYVLNYIIFSINLEILNFLKILMIEVLYNVLLVTIGYPLIQKFGYYMENEYKGNKILTRYF